MFATMKPYADHVRGLLGEQVTDVVACRQTVTVDRFAAPDAFRDYFKTNYGPTVATYRGIAGEPHRVAALDADLTDLARLHDQGEGRTVMEWEYLLLTARKRR
jgi:hypothetical protein